MNNSKAIDHFFSYRHFYFAVTFLYIQYFNSQPLAEEIIFHHVGYYLLWSGGHVIWLNVMCCDIEIFIDNI